MNLAPSTVEALRQSLRAAHERRERVEIVDLCALNRVLDHRPEDMTVSVEAGLVLADLQARLATCGQWLPIDPPYPENLTVGNLLNVDASGPRRFGYGTIREHLLGLTVALADGRLVHSGGRVVKNVAGFDLMKLFVGARGSLGVIAEATFKVRPLPESESILAIACADLDEAERHLEALSQVDLGPVVLDLASVPGTLGAAQFAVVAGFAGPREEVEWQTKAVQQRAPARPGDLEYERTFWREVPGAPVHRLSILPSRLTAGVRQLGGASFVARAGQGVIYYRGSAQPTAADWPVALNRRVKATFDPHQILPEAW